MRALLVTAFLLIGLFSSAQFYYQDIVGTAETSRRMKTLLAANVRTITATGLDAQNVKSTDFDERHDVRAADRVLRINTRNNRSVTTVYYHFDEKFRLTSTRDSSSLVQVISTYAYDNKDNLLSIKTEARDKDTLQNFSATEEHQWLYGANGKPEKMWRIVNGKDSFEYRFVIDDQGHVAEEKLFRRGVEADFIYYYYDDKGQVTDIVRFNKTLMSLIPDVVLTYDENGQVIQKITPVSFKNPNYLTWRYGFDEKGLKIREALFNKNKERTGTIVYQYTYGQ